MLHHFIEVGEYGLALEEVAGTLAQHAIAITGQERGDMRALATQMKLHSDLVSRALAACPQTGGHKLGSYDRWLPRRPGVPALPVCAVPHRAWHPARVPGRDHCPHTAAERAARQAAICR